MTNFHMKGKTPLVFPDMRAQRMEAGVAFPAEIYSAIGNDYSIRRQLNWMAKEELVCQKKW